MDNVKLQLNHLLFSGDFGLRENQERYLETLAPILETSLKNGQTDDVLDVLLELETQKEAELKSHCDACTEPFLRTAEYLEQINDGANEIGACADLVSVQITRSGTELIKSSQKQQSLAITTGNIRSTLETLKLCLKGLEYTNQVHSLLKQNHRIAAVQAISELRALSLYNMKHLGLGKMLSKSIPGLSALVLASTRAQLDKFLEDLTSGDLAIGELAYECLAKQRATWQQLQHKFSHLAAFRFNSYAERAYRESTVNYFNIDKIGLDLGPLFEAHLVYQKLGKLDELLPYIHQTRFNRSRVLDATKWDALQIVVGFFVVERVISESMPELRPPHLVKDTWDQFCQRFLQDLSSNITGIKTLEELNPIKVAIIEVMETLENFEFNVSPISAVLHELLKHLSKLAVDASRTSFLKMWNSADHMPMVVNKAELYQKLKNVVFEGLEATPTSFPKALPFSEIYPLMCVDLSALIALHSTFFDQFQRDPVIVEETMLEAVDEYLSDTVCKTMASVGTDNRERLVQTVIDLRYFCDASVAVRSMLQQNRLSGRRGSLNLRAVSEFENAYRVVESRVFDLVNSSITNFVATADYDWQQKYTSQGTESQYALDMATYLLTLANSVFARLPSDLRSFLYLSCVHHLNQQLMQLLLSAPDPLSQETLRDFDIDLKFLEKTVEQLRVGGNEANPDTLTEVRQCVDLLKSEDPTTEYQNSQVRMRKYDRIDQQTATHLLKKLSTPVSTPKMPQSAKFMRYLSGDKT